MADQFIDPEYIHPDFERILSDKPLPMQFLYRDIRQLSCKRVRHAMSFCTIPTHCHRFTAYQTN